MIQLLDIEKELTGPDAAAALERFDAILLNLNARLEHALDEGMMPSEFTKAQSLKETIPLARKLLRLTMQAGHSA